MAVTTDQLIAKALSTSSEDEAFSCLRMARKRGGTASRVEVSNPNRNWKYEAEQWKKVAYSYKELCNQTADSKTFWINQEAKKRIELNAIRTKYDKLMMVFITVVVCWFTTTLLLLSML